MTIEIEGGIRFYMTEEEIKRLWISEEVQETIRMKKENVRFST
jgi:hypothetical protein